MLALLSLVEVLLCAGIAISKMAEVKKDGVSTRASAI